MTKRFLLLAAFLLSTFAFISNHQKNEIMLNSDNNKNMKSIVSIFEIPATDISRAIQFYAGMLNITIEELEFPGMHMGLFPVEDQLTIGVILKEGQSKPSVNGVTIYLNAGGDLQPFLDRVDDFGGQIITPKTPHADESGFFALFLDSEGNRLGLHSTN